MWQLMKHVLKDQYLGFYHKFMTKNLIGVLILQNIILPPDLPSSQPESEVYCYTIVNCIEMYCPLFLFSLLLMATLYEGRRICFVSMLPSLFPDAPDFF